MARKFNESLSGLVFGILAKGILACSKLDERVSKEITTWEEGFTVMLSASAETRTIIGIRDGALRVLETDDNSTETLEIAFKSPEKAIKVCIGHSGLSDAYAQHAFVLKGDIFKCMSLVRIVNIVENYLFPAFITRKVLKQRPPKLVSSFRVYGKTLFGS